ncbi:hypothetical protein [Kosakonia sacchari]|uniref:Uncharacterized protein n=1 Tax=Kosakonia sacchari TaxID=1158459 RepID=A0ABZ0MPT7_9ENTR|nr:hypothetical protein [Kosakonia sacchari]WOZ77518.1 hypothetical protein Q8Y70_00140 [Kosakonia sacchari]
MKIDSLSVPVFPQPILREETSAKNKRDIPTGSLYTGPQNNNDDRPVRPDARSLVFTPDPRGEGYPSIEKQIAGQMIRQREGQTSESGFTASYGAPYEARKSLLAYGLSAAGIHDPASLSGGGHTQTTALLDKVREQYAASPQTHYDAQGNTRTPSLLVAAARDFFDQQINTGAQYKTNTHDDVPGLEGRALAQYSDRDKVQSLRHFAGQPLRTEQNEPTNAERVMKDIGALLMLDGIAAEAGAMAEFFTEKAVATEGRSALATLRNTSEQAAAGEAGVAITSEAGTAAAEMAMAGEARAAAAGAAKGIMAGETTAAVAGETGTAAVNRLRPSLAGDISQYAVKDGEALLKESRASAGGIHQVKDAAGNDRWLLRYREGAGESKVYEVGQDFRPGEGRARIIDPQTRQPVLTVQSGNGEWQRSALPGGVNPGNAPAGKMYGNPRADLPEQPLDLRISRPASTSRPSPMDVDSQPGPSTARATAETERPLDLSMPRRLPDSRSPENSLPPTPGTPIFTPASSRAPTPVTPFSPAMSESYSATGLPRTPGASLFGSEGRSSPLSRPLTPGAESESSAVELRSGNSSRSSTPSSVATSGAGHTPYADDAINFNPWADNVQLPPGSYLNDRGYIERRDFNKLYRVEQADRVDRRGDPQNVGFRDGNYFAGVEKMMSGPVVFVARTREGAERFGRGELINGFHLYEIDAQGIPGVSLRENIEHNEQYMELANTMQPGYVAGLRSVNQLERFGDYAWSFDEVHLANDQVTPDKITKIY